MAWNNHLIHMCIWGSPFFVFEGLPVSGGKELCVVNYKGWQASAIAEDSHDDQEDAI